MGLRKAIRRWLQIMPATDDAIYIKEPSSFETNAIKNRILYRGDPSELDQFFKNTAVDEVTRARFWASSPSRGMRIRKIHSGLPGITVDMLSDIVTGDMLDVEFLADDNEAITNWGCIAEENEFKNLLTKAVQEVLVVGDGAFKLSIDPDISKYPLLDFHSGETVLYRHKRGRLREVIFLSKYTSDKKTYILSEQYGQGYVRYRLEDEDGKEVALDTVEELEGLSNIEWDGDYMMAVPLKVYSSPKWEHRGRSIFDLKTDAYDALDETISQWQDSIRQGRIKRYIPDSMIPRDPNTGEALGINPFDNQFVALRSNRAENAHDTITTDQPRIQYEGYINTYINNLDMCLQGVISPSTLGIDTKKIENAEAQREKEKTTLYTRQKIVSALQEVVPVLVDVSLQTYATMTGSNAPNAECMIDFGEYANPSFEAQVETVGKASSSGIMSIRTQIETIWGDTRNKKWIDAEERRILQERGIMEFEEPSMLPGGYIEEDMISGMGRLDSGAADRDGNLSISVDDEEPAEAHGRRDEGRLPLDTMAGDADEKPEEDEA